MHVRPCTRTRTRTQHTHIKVKGISRPERCSVKLHVILTASHTHPHHHPPPPPLNTWLTSECDQLTIRSCDSPPHTTPNAPHKRVRVNSFAVFAPPPPFLFIDFGLLLFFLLVLFKSCTKCSTSSPFRRPHAQFKSRRPGDVIMGMNERPSERFCGCDCVVFQTTVSAACAGTIT